MFNTHISHSRQLFNIHLTNIDHVDSDIFVLVSDDRRGRKFKSGERRVNLDVGKYCSLTGFVMIGTVFQRSDKEQIFLCSKNFEHCMHCMDQISSSVVTA